MGCRFCGLGTRLCGLGTRFRRLCVRLRRFGRRFCAGFGRVSGLGGVGVICTTYGAVVAIPSVGCVAALFTTTSAGVPVPVIVGGPGGGEIVGVAQCRLDHITAGGAGLRGGFRSRRARCVGVQILSVTTNAAFVPVVGAVLAPVCFVVVGGGTSSTTKVTFSVAIVVIAMGAFGLAKATDLVNWVNHLIACAVVVQNCIFQDVDIVISYFDGIPLRLRASVQHMPKLIIITEGFLTNAGDTVGDDGGGQINAAVEHMILNDGNTIRNSDAG